MVLSLLAKLAVDWMDPDWADEFLERRRWRYVRETLPLARTSTEVTLRIPGYRQLQTYTCGYVAGLMVLHCFQRHRSAEAFFKKVRPHDENGTSTTRLVGELRRAHIGVSERRDLNFSKVCAAIDAGFPIIVCVKTDLPDVSHWVVIYGYSTKPNRVFVAGDGIPYLSNKRVPWCEFVGWWEERGFGLVCWGK